MTDHDTPAGFTAEEVAKLKQRGFTAEELANDARDFEQWRERSRAELARLTPEQRVRRLATTSLDDDTDQARGFNEAMRLVRLYLDWPYDEHGREATGDD